MRLNFTQLTHNKMKRIYFLLCLQLRAIKRETNYHLLCAKSPSHTSLQKAHKEKEKIITKTAATTFCLHGQRKHFSWTIVCDFPPSPFKLKLELLEIKLHHLGTS